MTYRYIVPTGFKFTAVNTMRDARRLARENNAGSQWFEKQEKATGRTLRRYRFNGSRWK